MKRFAATILALVLALPLRADILANGSFADGAAHWSGDGHAGDSGGLVIQLDPEKWTTVSQTFDTRETALDFTVNYQTSADSTLAKAGGSLSAATVGGPLFRRDINVKPGRWVVLLLDGAAGKLTFHRFKSPQGDAGEQTAHATFAQLLAHEEKTLVLAFPPSHGTVTLSNVALAPAGATAGVDGDTP
ncbi:MAG: hypothetical protein WDO13_18420 [Verrucomicrobiota bacterium]